MTPEGNLRPDTVEEALALFLDAKLIQRHDVHDGSEGSDSPFDSESERTEAAIYKIPSQRRIALEYYNNNILHFFVPSALIAAATTLGEREWASVPTLRSRVQELSRVFKYEFQFRADATFDEIFDDALTDMIESGELVRRVGEAGDGDEVAVAPGEGGAIVATYASMLRPYFEAYLVAVRGTRQLLDKESMPKKEWIKKVLATGVSMYLAGEVERRESVSKLKLETALKALKDYALITVSGDDVKAGNELTSVEAVEELERQLLAFLDPAPR